MFLIRKTEYVYYKYWCNKLQQIPVNLNTHKIGESKTKAK